MKKNSDVDLATVELVFDAKIASHVDGHVMLKYEDDEVFVDEGFITLTGNDAFPAYLIAGRQYIPFGNFDSHFVTDPNTLILGETNEGAGVAGYRFGGKWWISQWVLLTDGQKKQATMTPLTVL